MTSFQERPCTSVLLGQIHIIVMGEIEKRVHLTCLTAPFLFNKFHCTANIVLIKQYQQRDSTPFFLDKFLFKPSIHHIALLRIGPSNARAIYQALVWCDKGETVWNATSAGGSAR